MTENEMIKSYTNENLSTCTRPDSKLIINSLYTIQSLTTIRNECTRLIREHFKDCVKISETTRETDILKAILELTNSSTKLNTPELETKPNVQQIVKQPDEPILKPIDVNINPKPVKSIAPKSISDTKLISNNLNNKCLKPIIKKVNHPNLSKNSIVRKDNVKSQIKPTVKPLLQKKDSKSLKLKSILHKNNPKPLTPTKSILRSFSAPENRSRATNFNNYSALFKSFSFPNKKTIQTKKNLQRPRKCNKSCSTTKKNLNNKTSNNIFKSLEGDIKIKSKNFKNVMRFPKLKLPFKSRLKAGGKSIKELGSRKSVRSTDNQTFGPSCNRDTCRIKPRTQQDKDDEVKCCKCSLLPHERKRLKKKIMNRLMIENNPILSGPFAHKLSDYFNRGVSRTKEPGVIGFNSDGTPIYSQATQLLQQFGDELRRPICAFRKDGEPVRHPNDKSKITYLGTFEDDDSPITGHVDLVNGMIIHNINGYGKIQYDAIVKPESLLLLKTGSKKSIPGKKVPEKTIDSDDENESLSLDEEAAAEKNATKIKEEEQKNMLKMCKKYPFKYDIGDCWPYCQKYHKHCKKSNACEKSAYMPKDHYPGKIGKTVLRVIKWQRHVRSIKDPERLIQKGTYSHTRNIPPQIIGFPKGFREYCNLINYWRSCY